MNFLDYACKKTDELEKEFFTNSKLGLSNGQLELNKKKWGLNIVDKKSKTWLEYLFDQYKSPMIILLLFAALISAILGENINAIIIFFVIVINTFISFYQEYFASKQVSLLEGYLSRTSKVVRNGKIVIVESSNIVPGDLIVLEPGDHIPADMRIIEANNLGINESALSGESAPVKKIGQELNFCPQNIFCASNIGFGATTVVEGNGKGIVFAIGQESSFGKISDLTLSTVSQTRFFKNLRKLSNLLIYVIVITMTILVIAHIFLKPTVSVSEILMFAVALAVGIAPEALPSISNFALSRGALMLAKNKVIVKRLSSVEDLGGLEIICTDKTGTITENRLSIEDINSINYDYKSSIIYMALAASRKLEHDVRPINPFDDAVWEKLMHQDFLEIAKYTRAAEVPFDSGHRRNIVLVKREQDFTLINNGDFHEIASRSKLSLDQIKSFEAWINQKAKEGCRVIAVSKKNIGPEVGNKIFENGGLRLKDLMEYENEMEFVAVVALFDPIRKTVKYSMDQARKLGLQVKIITGDDAPVASNIAKEIGLVRNIEDFVTGQEFASMSDSEKERIAIVVPVFARFLPEQKHEVIKILKKTKSVGYLGDGINDAPAIKEADVGFAVAGAVDIAKDAADIILVKKSLVTIIEGIKIGRAVFVNTFNYLKITLASNIGNFFSIAIVSVFIPFLPLLPLQILLLNLLSDAPMIAISTDNVSPSDLARPTSYNMKNLLFFIFVFGSISSIFDLIFFHKFYKAGFPEFLQTNWFIFSIATEILFIFSGRSKAIFTKATRPSIWVFLFSAITIILAIAIPFTGFGQNIFGFINPSFYGIFLILGIGAAYFLSCEIFKLFYYKFIVPNNGHRTQV